MRRVLAALGAGAALTLAAAPALACPPKSDPYPASQGWHFVDHEKTTIPAGYACVAQVSFVITGHERTLINDKVPPANYVPKPGDRAVSESPDEHALFSNDKTGQRYWVTDDGTFVDVLKRNGTDLRSTGYGRNFLFGQGVTGIPFAANRHSVQKFTVTDYADPVKNTIHVHLFTGRQVDLCHKLGTESVPGKNLPQTGGTP